MQTEISKKPLVDILSEMLGVVVVIDGDNYVTLVGNELVDASVLEDAIVKQESELDAQTLAKFKEEVQAALSATSITIERIQQGVILGTCAYTNADVIAFVQYIRTLRTLLSATTVTSLPTKPPYPAGT